MSTRSLTHIYDDGKILLTFYRQSDGYPEGHGKDLSEFLTGFQIVNGLSGDKGKIANGMGCLAAQIIKHFKECPGGIYIYPLGSSDCGEKYVYSVKISAEKPIGDPKWSRTAHEVEMICAEAGGPELFKGNPSAFAAFLTKIAETA
jgi:hypothetical protein